MPVHLLIDGEGAVAPSESFVCFGDAPEVTFVYDGVKHCNDARSCHYTPLKGLIAYQENADDWDALRSAYWRAGTALQLLRGQDRTENGTDLPFAIPTTRRETEPETEQPKES